MVPSIWHARLMSVRKKGGKGVREKVQERVKKLAISRRDAEAQRFELNNCFIFLVDSAPLRLCARYPCCKVNFFTRF
jgi:hypothetical protein